MILLTGAAGKSGRAILRALTRRGARVRALVRREAQRAEAIAAGASEVVVADMRDGSHWRSALQGIRALYHIAPNMSPDEVRLGRYAIEAGQAAGLAHFVYHSVLHPQIEAMPHHWEKLRVEEALFASGLPCTILQPAAYMQNILGGWSRITSAGRHTVPYAIESRLSLVDLGDVAEVAALVLTEAGHDGATYELCGPDAPTQVEVATLLSQTLGREVEAEALPHDVWAAQARAGGVDPTTIERLQQMFGYYERHGFIGNPRVLTWLLGRPPTTLATFLARVAGSGDV